MKAWTKTCWASVVAASLVAVARADEAAIVRISDRLTPTPDPGPGASAPAVPGAVPASCDGAGVGASGAGGFAEGGWYNPTQGFRPYAAAPVYREAIVYNRYWPDRWYGDPRYNLRPMFPQVYMPTDTTQLGVYYARVPQWMPNPNMYPPPPRPEDWHRHVVYAGGGGAGCNGGVIGAGTTIGVGTGGGVGVGVSAPSNGGPAVGSELGSPSSTLGQPVGPSQPIPQAQPPGSAPPAPTPMPQPSAGLQAPQQGIQSASGSGERHWLLDDIMNGFSKSRTPQVQPISNSSPQEVTVPQPSGTENQVPPAPAPAAQP